MYFEEIICHKRKGDFQLSLQNFHQASRHYSDALKKLSTIYDIDENYGVRINEMVCYSNLEAKILSKRSIAFLNMKQYYHAYQDANQIIEIIPEWFEGYVRKANIEMECGIFEESIKNFHLALRYLNLEKKDDHRIRLENNINQSIKHALFKMQRNRIWDYQIIWIGTALGLVFGMALVSWDFVQNRNNSYVKHPLLKLLVIGICSFIFYNLTRLHRYFTRTYHENLLKPPYKEKID